MKKVLGVFTLFLFIFSNSFAEEKKAISKFNGAYTYSHFCTNEPEPKYDGSRFIIEDGVVSNDKGGGGRWDIKKYKLNKKGNLSIQAQRKNKKYIFSNMNYQSWQCIFNNKPLGVFND